MTFGIFLTDFVILLKDELIKTVYYILIFQLKSMFINLLVDMTYTVETHSPVHYNLTGLLTLHFPVRNEKSFSNNKFIIVFYNKILNFCQLF